MHNVGEREPKDKLLSTPRSTPYPYTTLFRTDPRCKSPTTQAPRQPITSAPRPTTPAPRPTTTRRPVPTTTRKVRTPRPTTAATRIAETTSRVNCYPESVDPR